VSDPTDLSPDPDDPDELDTTELDATEPGATELDATESVDNALVPDDVDPTAESGNESIIADPASEDALLDEPETVAVEPELEPEPIAASRELRLCTTCGESSPVDANWCEACGNDLDALPEVPKNPCVSCGASPADITDDDWCQLCGTKQPSPEDHVVADHGWFAIVSDRGRVHRHNEDAGAVGARATGVALVVCDGVSSTDASQDASQNAARTIIGFLEQAGPGAIETGMIEGSRAAQTEIVAVTARDSAEPPSCTMVAAVADTSDDGATAELHVGWLGDSRAYWLTADSATALTTDHSWAVEQAELGELDAEAIAADPRASSITRWLGADSHDVTPEIMTQVVDLPGILLVCSDGLWNYAQTEAEILAIVHAGADDELPLDQAERLVAFANEQGGHDNITVAIAHFSAPTQPSPSTATSSAATESDS
jgi:serine/threonine protein phosphatase PrpC